MLSGLLASVSWAWAVFWKLLRAI